MSGYHHRHGCRYRNRDDYIMGLASVIIALLVIVAPSIPYIRKKACHEWIPPAARW